MSNLPSIDPDANLQEQREIRNELQYLRHQPGADIRELAFKLVEVTSKLDDHLSHTEDGDDLPMAWFRIDEDDD